MWPSARGVSLPSRLVWRQAGGWTRRGLVVAPGFIDLHSHVHSIAGQRLQAHDGVTTSLDLEAGTSPLSRAYETAACEGRPLNYGFSASWGALRLQILAGVPADGKVLT